MHACRVVAAVTDQVPWPFAGDGVHRDQECARCGQLYSCVTVVAGELVCGACRGWIDPTDADRGAAAIASLMAAVAAERARRGVRYLP